MLTFRLTPEFLHRVDEHNLSGPTFRLYLDLLTFAVDRRQPSVHELVVFAYAVKREQNTDPYPTSALELLRAGLLTDVYTARGDLHAFLVADAIPYASPTAAHRRPISDQLRAAVHARDGHQCLTCGSPHDLQLDHIIAWSLGGPDHETNLETLCGPCNARKSNRPRRSLTTASAS